MKKKTIVIKSTAGIHAKLAAKIVHLSQAHDVKVYMQYEDRVIDAASILGLMSLAVPPGTNVDLIAEGPDADQAIAAIEGVLG